MEVAEYTEDLTTPEGIQAAYKHTLELEARESQEAEALQNAGVNQPDAPEETATGETKPEPKNESGSLEAPSKVAGDKGQETGAKGTAEPQKAAKETEKEAAKSKYAREQERRDNSWKALNAEKEALAREKAEAAAQWKAEREQLAKERAAAQQERHSPEKYEEAAALWEKQGQVEKAEEARAYAKELREKAAKEQARGYTDDDLKLAHTNGFNAVLQKFPDVGTKDSPLQKELIAVLRENPKMLERPDCYEMAIQIADGKARAAKVPDLEKAVTERDAQITTLKSEVERLTKLTTITGGGNHQAPQPKAYEDMTPDEQLADWKRRHGAADE